MAQYGNTETETIAIKLDVEIKKGSDRTTVGEAIFNMLCSMGDDDAAVLTVDELVFSFNGWDPVSQ